MLNVPFPPLCPVLMLTSTPRCSAADGPSLPVKRENSITTNRMCNPSGVTRACTHSAVCAEILLLLFQILIHGDQSLQFLQQAVKQRKLLKSQRWEPLLALITRHSDRLSASHLNCACYSVETDIRCEWSSKRFIIWCRAEGQTDRAV